MFEGIERVYLSTRKQFCGRATNSVHVCTADEAQSLECRALQRFFWFQRRIYHRSRNKATTYFPVIHRICPTHVVVVVVVVLFPRKNNSFRPVFCTTFCKMRHRTLLLLLLLLLLFLPKLKTHPAGQGNTVALKDGTAPKSSPKTA